MALEPRLPMTIERSASETSKEIFLSRAVHFDVFGDGGLYALFEERLRVGREFYHVDFLAAELAHYALDARAARANARANGVDARIGTRNRNLRAVPGSRAMASIFTEPSAISDTSSSKSFLTNL